MDMADPKTTNVILTPNVPSPTRDENVALYNSIRNCSENLSFNTYAAFLTSLFCKDTKIGEINVRAGRIFARIVEYATDLKTTDLECLTGSRAYEAVRRATEVFVTLVGAPPETCNCFRDLRHEGGRRIITPPEDLAAVRVAESIRAAEEGSDADDLADINRRYFPNSLTSEELQDLIADLLSLDADLPPPAPGDSTGKLLPMMRRLRANLRGVVMKGSEGDDCSGVLRWRLECPPFVELIWSYWMEQAMLVQGINAVSMRFQNQRRGVNDPLARMDITWLRPLNGLLWGYIQTELDRLTVVRRAYEYDHHYGLRLQGRAVPVMNTADSRPRFLEAFHNVLTEASRYYRLAMNTTVNPDTFPVLNSLKELHVILSEGAANQFGDLPATARQEMLIQQWLIGRPEMRDFLGGRPGVVYPESWMGHMDSLRQIYNWNDASIRHYRDLAYFGERLLLSVRWTDWTSISDSLYATSWLTFWRSEVQAYVHSYRAVTGVDLNTDEVRVAPQLLAAQPTDLILRRRPVPAALRAQ
jgi:hypothetical protein